MDQSNILFDVWLELFYYCRRFDEHKNRSTIDALIDKFDALYKKADLATQSEHHRMVAHTMDRK